MLLRLLIVDYYIFSQKFYADFQLHGGADTPNPHAVQNVQWTLLPNLHRQVAFVLMKTVHIGVL